MIRDIREDQAEMIERLSIKDQSILIIIRVNQSLVRKEADLILSAPDPGPGIPGEGRDRDRIKEVVIRRGLAVGLGQDQKDLIQSQGILRQSLITSLQDRVVLDQDLDRGVQVQEVLTAETRDDHDPGTDPALVAESRTITADHVPLAAVGVRGHTDIEMAKTVQVVF